MQEVPDGSTGKQLVSDTLIRVQLQVPGWFLLPTAAIERTGEGACWGVEGAWGFGAALHLLRICLCQARLPV